jgi:Cu/Zn superoxide dismutase
LTFVAGKDGKGVDITVTLTGFKNETGPFGYHIHDQPVPADGNCTGTKAHLDPYQRGQATPCDNKKPETCEVGDLAGKYGKIPAPTDGEFGSCLLRLLLLMVPIPFYGRDGSSRSIEYESLTR